MPKSYTYGQLDQKSPEYHGDLWEKLDELYEGGFSIHDDAKRFLPRYIGENEARYKERLASASYIPYLGAICDQFTGHLFAIEPVVAPAADAGDDQTVGELPEPDPFWQQFAHNSDLRGSDFVAVLRCAFQDAILKRRGIIGCDFPYVTVDAASRAEEDASGASRGYAFHIPVEQLYDWEYSDVIRRVAKVGGKEFTFEVGYLQWAVLKRELDRRGGPEGNRGLVVDEFKVWTLGESGHAEWAVYHSEPHKRDEQVKPDQELKLIDEGVTTFRCIPIVEMCMPKGLWLGNKLGPLAIELFQGRSALNAAINKSLFAIPVVKLASESTEVAGAMPAELAQNPNRGNDPAAKYRAQGFMVLGNEDELEYPEPSGKSFEIRNQLLRELVDEMYRVSHQMAASIANTSSSLGRSGRSKDADWRTTAIVLEAYAAIVRDEARRVYETISDARGENVVWVVHGMDSFEQDDRETLIKETAGQTIPSKTFQAEYKFRLAMALLGNVSPETQDAIKTEIVDGVKDEENVRSPMTDAEVKLAQKSVEPEDDDVAEEAA